MPQGLKTGLLPLATPEVFLMERHIAIMRLFTRSMLWLLLVTVAPFIGAQSASGADQQKPFPEVQAEASKLAAQGYSVIGPAFVRSYDSTKLALDPERWGKEYSLAGKSVVVKDQNLKQTGSHAIAKGSMVYVCAKSKEIIVFVIKDEGTTRGDNPGARKGADQ